MIKAASIVVVAVLLGACDVDGTRETDEFDCSRSLCGCSSPDARPVTLRLANEDGDPVGDARLVCHDDGTFLGRTNTDGLLTIQVSGANTPGCGFMPDCQVAYFRTDNDQFGRHFWFARFVRGEPVSAKAHAVELVDDSD